MLDIYFLIFYSSTMQESFKATSSGRICLLGDNTDLIEKPAIAAAISAYLTVTLSKRNDDRVILIGRDINYREEFKMDEKIIFDSPLKYVKAVLERLRNRIDTGFQMEIQSSIPISAGLSSSTALCIAAIRGFNEAYNIKMAPSEIAELAFIVENKDLHIECGRMDQYAIAFGGITYIKTGADADAERLPLSSLPIVVADTQEQHDTKALQIWLRKRIKDREENLLNSLNRVVTLVEEGKQAIIEGDMVKLGKLMNAQQKEEKFMGTSTERLEVFCKTAREAGALGTKQMGAGGGGCMIALCTRQNINSVQNALSSLDAPTWKFKVV